MLLVADPALAVALGRGWLWDVLFVGALLGAREALRERLPDPFDVGRGEGAGTSGQLGDRLWSVDDDPAQAELAKQRQTLNVEEAGRAAQVDVGLVRLGCGRDRFVVRSQCEPRYHKGGQQLSSSRSAGRASLVGSERVPARR